jgi:hypothetical protein
LLVSLAGTCFAGWHFLYSWEAGVRKVTLFLYKFKKHPGLPVLAMVTTMLLISGQVLNCCGINESLSASLAKTLQTLGIIDVHKAKVASEAEPKSHPNCPGHGSETASEALVTAKASQPLVPAEPGQNQYAAKESCLSERTLSVNAQPSNPDSPINLAVQAQIAFRAEFARFPVQAEKPRPQNKSSPPLYLLTLRILV